MSLLVGYAAVFFREDDPATQYELRPGLVERIERGAFARAIVEGHDVRALFNHDANQVLGRVPDTLSLVEDAIGLRYTIVLPDTQLGRDLAALVARGDITGSSFSFMVRAKRDDKLVDGTRVWTLLDVDLYDVGPVTFPAYEATTAETRARLEREARESALRAEIAAVAKEIRRFVVDRESANR